MIQAMLHGKMSSEQLASEDILTSTVLGLLEFLDDPSPLINLLNSSMTIQGNKLQIPLVSPTVNWYFWPSFTWGEPDVVLVLEEGASSSVICIEVKYRSGKSSHESRFSSGLQENLPRDQLARQYFHMNDVVVKKSLGLDPEKHIDVYLIYLTDDSSLPKSDLLESLEVLRKHRFDITKLESTIGWLSWRQFIPALVENQSGSQDKRIIQRIIEFLSVKGLVSFSGFSTESVTTVSWKYSPWAWCVQPVQNVTFDYNREVNV